MRMVTMSAQNLSSGAAVDKERLHFLSSPDPPGVQEVASQQLLLPWAAATSTSAAGGKQSPDVHRGWGPHLLQILTGKIGLGQQQ
jgi:hypothetical protein